MLKHFTALNIFTFSILFCAAQATEKPNIILIMFDDMNDWVEGYDGHPQTSTPALLNIASYGTTFLNAFCSAPVCAPSRTSLLTGKNPRYTGIYNNEEYDDSNFRANFSEDKYIITLPEHLKDNAGYYTYSLDKIFHADQNFPDYDTVTLDNCSKSLSWSKASYVVNNGGVINEGDDLDQAVENFEFAKIDDSFNELMQDYKATDEAIEFINDYQANPDVYCNKPFFLAFGFHKPHLQLYIPEQYFLPDYIDDFYAEPFNIPYNFPVNNYPYNGVVLSPQPEIKYQDYDSLGFVGTAVAAPAIHDDFEDWAEGLETLPNINDTLFDNERIDILTESKTANATMAYLAAIKFVDAQLARFWSALEENPEIFNNSVIILASDHGYSLDEKKHWKKNALWETDIRVPLIIVDMRNSNPQITYIPVSLLDLYPTICDYALVSPPVFPDSSIYLEGRNIRSVIENNGLNIESPALTTYKNQSGKQASCMEQFSVHNNRFHYIQYHSNNVEGNLTCDSLNSVIEEELYEIGENRDIDINEWNNLIKTGDYGPVKKYLNQWLPGNIMFTKKTFKPFINIQSLPCLVNELDTLDLSFSLYDTSGVLVSPPPGFKYYWTNNLSADTISGVSPKFPLHILGTEIINSNEIMYIYFQMTDTTNGAIIGFDMRSVYLNDLDVPTVDFNVLTEYFSTSVTVSDISISGTYNNIWWDFGNGYIFYGPDPGPYNYTDYGTNTITCYVNFGNGDECIDSFSRTFQTLSFDYNTDDDLLLFPNPAGDILNIATSELVENGEIIISDVTGKQVNNFVLENNILLINTIDISSYSTGIYFVTLKTSSRYITEKLIIF